MLVASLLIAPSIVFAASIAFAGPSVAGIPVEFILFAAVLLVAEHEGTGAPAFTYSKEASCPTSS